MFRLALLFSYFQNTYFFNIPINKHKTQVHLHLEQFNTKLNLYHIGISFKNDDTIIKYDYRPFCETNNCDSNNCELNKCEYNITNTINKDSKKEVTIIQKIYKFYIMENMPNKTIYWGETNKTLEEVQSFEKTLQKKYILGINDCRHYVNCFSRWALNKRTPIWNLHKLWNQIH